METEIIQDEKIIPDVTDTDHADVAPTTPILTPRKIELSEDSCFATIERLLKLDHGVDGDTKEKNPIISLTIHPNDTSIVATGGHEGGVRIWRLPGAPRHVDPTGKKRMQFQKLTQITTLLGHSSQVNGVRFSPDGEYLATCSGDATVRVYESSKWKLVHSLRSHTLDVMDVSWFSPTILVSTSTDRNSIVWDAVTGGRLQTLYSDKASCPKGIVSDPKGDYLCVLFDEGLIDVYRRNSDGKFRLSRHVDLAKEDPKNYAKAFKTTLYPRRATWTPSGDRLLLPLGSRGRYGPCGVMYDRSNLLEPMPDESLVAEKVLAGHPSRIVIVSIKPSQVRLPETEEPCYITAMVSVDGVLSLWSSTAERPIAVIANMTAPLRVCTDACWSGNSLLLSSSDGSVTTVNLYNIGTEVVVSKKLLGAHPSVQASVPGRGVADIKSNQVELRVGGKRKIQPVVATVDTHAVAPVLTAVPSELSSHYGGHSVHVKNGPEKLIVTHDEGWKQEFTGSSTAVCLMDAHVVIACRSNEGTSTVVFLDCSTGSVVNAPIIMPESVTLITANADGVVALVAGTSCVCVWRLVGAELESVIPDISLDGVPEGIKAVRIEGCSPVCETGAGKTLKYNPRIQKWILSN